MGGAHLLEAATKQYNSKIWKDANRARGEIRIAEHDPIPFNELDQAQVGEGLDHWYQLDPKSKVATRYYLPHRKSLSAGGPHGKDNWTHLSATTSKQFYQPHRRLSSASIQVLGCIFTARLPRGLDIQQCHDNASYVRDNGELLLVTDELLATLRAATEADEALKYPHGISNTRVLRERIALHQIQLILILVEDEEMEKVQSTSLISFYTSCGTDQVPIEIIRTPFSDFSSSARCIEHQDFVKLCMAITQGRNCLIHCFGGSGPTGTLAVGALCCVGLFNPPGAIKFAHMVKSTYIETPDQLMLIEGEFDETVYNVMQASETVEDIPLLDVHSHSRLGSELAEMIQRDDSRNSYLLDLATKQYNSAAWKEAGRARGAVYAAPGTDYPFNETPAAMQGDGPDHWYHLDLKSESTRKFHSPNHTLSEESIRVLGSIFTTRVPRAIDYQTIDSSSHGTWAGEDGAITPLSDACIQSLREKKLVSDEFNLHWKYGVTNGAKLAAKLRHHKISLIVSLVEDEELDHVHSKRLVEFYESCSTPGNTIKVLRTPFVDFSCPSHCLEHLDIVEICTTLAQGKNCLVHCFGGSGRTGTIVVGVLCCLGLFTPKLAIKFAHTVKSTYIETPDQLDLVRGEFDEIFDDGQSVSDVVGCISWLQATGHIDEASDIASSARLMVETQSPKAIET